LFVTALQKIATPFFKKIIPLRKAPKSKSQIPTNPKPRSKWASASASASCSFSIGRRKRQRKKLDFGPCAFSGAWSLVLSRVTAPKPLESGFQPTSTRQNLSYSNPHEQQMCH